MPKQLSRSKKHSFLTIEHSYNPEMATQAIRRALTHRDQFVWLDPPPFLGTVTVVDVHRAEDLAEHEALVKRWAESAWSAWAPHHETVRRWARLGYPE